MRALVAATISCLALWYAAAAAAEPSRVVVLRDPSAPAAVSEASLRTQAELRAEGFEVVLRDVAVSGDVRAALESASREGDAVAAIAVVSDPAGAAADLWVTDRITGKTSIRRIEVIAVAPSERPRALAIRAVELLRASLVEAVVLPTEAKPPPDVKRWLEPPPVGPLSGPHAALSVGMLTGFDGIGPAGAPVVRLGWAADFGLGGRVSWLGPALGARADSPLGSAAIRQELATFDVLYAPPVEWAGFTPMVWAGAGVYHLFAEGELLMPLTGQSDEVWAFAGVGGLGIGYRLTPALTAWLDAEGALTTPRAVVTLFGEPLGTMGRPMLLSSLGISLHF